MTATTREHDVFTYVNRLFGPGSRGWVGLAVGSGPHLADDGRYGHAGFKQMFFAWPSQLNEIIRKAVRSSETGDVYVCPALRNAKSRKKLPGGDTAQAGCWLWTDVDGEWTDERQVRWERFKGTGAFMVHSGRGRHLYVPTGALLEPADLEAKNRKLCALFDSEKWESNALLRMPGTVNWKPWAFGLGDPAPVRLVTP